MIVQGSFAGVKQVGYCGICGRPLSNPASVAAGVGPICGGKHGRPTGLPKADPDMGEWGDIFRYAGYGNCDCHCYIKVHGNAVICTEAPENTGTSVTNMAEGIATQVCHQFGIPRGELIWIEHYLHAGSDIGETFDLVTFSEADGKLVHPQWKHAGKDAAMRLFNG